MSLENIDRLVSVTCSICGKRYREFEHYVYDLDSWDKLCKKCEESKSK